jgi:hypothetical protein
MNQDLERKKRISVVDVERILERNDLLKNGMFWRLQGNNHSDSRLTVQDNSQRTGIINRYVEEAQPERAGRRSQVIEELVNDIDRINLTRRNVRRLMPESQGRLFLLNGLNAYKKQAASFKIKTSLNLAERPEGNPMLFSIQNREEKPLNTHPLFKAAQRVNLSSQINLYA